MTEIKHSSEGFDVALIQLSKDVAASENISPTHAFIVSDEGSSYDWVDCWIYEDIATAARLMIKHHLEVIVGDDNIFVRDEFETITTADYQEFGDDNPRRIAFCVAILKAVKAIHAADYDATSQPTEQTHDDQ